MLTENSPQRMQMLNSLQNLQLFYCSVYEPLVQMSVAEDKEALEHVRKGWSHWEKSRECSHPTQGFAIPLSSSSFHIGFHLLLFILTCGPKEITFFTNILFLKQPHLDVLYLIFSDSTLFVHVPQNSTAFLGAFRKAQQKHFLLWVPASVYCPHKVSWSLENI